MNVSAVKIGIRSRRGFLTSACAAGVSGCTPDLAWSSERPFFESRDLPIGVQLYTLGDLPQKDLQGTLNTLKMTGYRAVELAGYHGKTPRELRSALDAAGLICSSAHIGARGRDGQPGLDGDLDKLAADLQIIGAEYVVIPSIDLPPEAQLSALPGESPIDTARRRFAALTPRHWQQFAGFLNATGKRLAQLGLRFAYHNHNFELAPLGQTSGFQILLEETDPSCVAFELDVGWIAAAGFDAVALLRASPGRYRLMHVKDVKKSTKPNFALELDGTEVGSGIVIWSAVLPAAYEAGVRHFFVEQEPPFASSRIASVAESCRFLSQFRI
jgi:sugar phosphate isomerase/epimerase